MRKVENPNGHGLCLSHALVFSQRLSDPVYLTVRGLSTMFIAQIVATTIAVFVNIGVQEWMFANIIDFCSPDQPNSFSCPTTSVFATAALIWGGIGPVRMFGPDSM